MKKLVSMLLAVAMMILLLPAVSASKEEGQCGDSVFWNWDDDGTLTIRGQGDMWDYKESTPPWYGMPVKNVVIEDGVTRIGAGALPIDGAIAVSIGGTVAEIGDYAFSGCIRLTSIVIPDSVKRIGERAFYACVALQDVTLGNGVAEIGDGAFLSCLSLTSVNIPESVGKVGKEAFSCCVSLNAVTVPAGVTSIGAGAFGGRFDVDDVFQPDMQFVLYGVPGSAAEQYAKEYGVRFRDASLPAVGDVNRDGRIDTTDARLLLQRAVSN